MKWTSSYLLCLLLGFVGTSCVDVVELDFPGDAPAAPWVVDGLITEGPGPYEIRIFRTSPLQSSLYEPAQLLSGKVRRDDGLEEPLLTGPEPGLFLLPGEVVRGAVGYRYQLEYELRDGQIYQSAWERMPPVSELDTVYLEITAERRSTGTGLVFRNFIDVFCDVNLTALPQSPYMRWETAWWWVFHEPPRSSPPSKSCYIQNRPETKRIHLFDGRGVQEEKWSREQMAFVEVDWRFFYKNFFNVIQYSLSPEAFQYWTRLEKVLEQSGSIFDSPPAAVRGNMYNLSSPTETVLGYFGASATDTLFYSVYRQDLNLGFVQDLCYLPYRAGIFGGDPCGDCLVIPNGTLERPYFW